MSTWQTTPLSLGNTTASIGSAATVPVAAPRDHTPFDKTLTFATCIATSPAPAATDTATDWVGELVSELAECIASALCDDHRDRDEEGASEEPALSPESIITCAPSTLLQEPRTTPNTTSADAAAAIEPERRGNKVERSYDPPLVAEYKKDGTIRLVLGHGEERIAIAIEATSEHVRLTLSVASADLRAALVGSQDELRARLQVHGLHLASFEASADEFVNPRSRGEEDDPLSAVTDDPLDHLTRSGRRRSVLRVFA